MDDGTCVFKWKDNNMEVKELFGLEKASSSIKKSWLQFAGVRTCWM